MDEDGYITVRRPRLGHGLYDGYVTVPEESVYVAIDALRIRVAQWDAFVGDQPADTASRARVADAAQALADLMRAMADHEREGGVRDLVKQIADFLSKTEAHAYLDGLRERLHHDKEVLSQQAHRIQQLGLGHLSTAAEVDQRVSEIARDLDILDALIALHEALERREEERMVQRDERQRKEKKQDHDQEQVAAEQATGDS